MNKEEIDRLINSPEQLAVQAEMSNQIRAAEESKRTAFLNGNQCFICYLDLDGFKEKLFSSPQDLFNSYTQLTEYINATFFKVNAESEGTIIKLHHFDKVLWPYVFSDSWFICTTDSSSLALNQLSTVAAGICMRLWEMGFPCHGGISEGPLWWRPDLQIMLGPGLANAYLLAESLDCFGVVADPSILNRAEQNTFTKSFSVPIKNNKCGEAQVEREFKFCRLLAHKTNRSYNTEHYLSLYDEMIASIVNRSDFKKSILNRYKRSREILEEMII